MTLLCATVLRIDSAAGQPAWSTRRVGLRLTVGLATLAGLAAIVGCHSPQAERRITQHQRSIDWASQTLVEREQTPDVRLRRTIDLIGDDVARDRRQLSRNLGLLDASFQFDVQRWRDRQEVYGDGFMRLLRGKPQNIEPALIIFY